MVYHQFYVRFFLFSVFFFSFVFLFALFSPLGIFLTPIPSPSFCSISLVFLEMSPRLELKFREQATVNHCDCLCEWKSTEIRFDYDLFRSKAMAKSRQRELKSGAPPHPFPMGIVMAVCHRRLNIIFPLPGKWNPADWGRCSLIPAL